ncbi:MAG: hypothetical protein LLF80_07685 [Porphyromonadaceae bacterium]|nr:hypothetical protein [Porphyromonadaceae bacterium]
MNEMISHIEFLLHEHNCVIIPGFGGFVVNTIPSRRDGIATFHAPACELVFNRDLTHNDGLLAESYMKSEQLMFEAAMIRIEKGVEELKLQLQEMHHVDMGKLGKFTMSDEKRFTYTPADFVRPALFGLTAASLRPLVQMQPVAPMKQAEPEKRWHSRGMSVAAAVAALLILILFPVSDSHSGHQLAEMIAETSLFGNKPAETHIQENGLSVKQTAVKSDVVPLQPAPEAVTVTATQNESQQVAATGPRFYVVMGVYELPDVAQKMIETLSNEGFTQTGSLKRPGRIDVFAASFTDETEAADFLREVHKKHPSHADAWILKKK